MKKLLLIIGAVLLPFIIIGFMCFSGFYKDDVTEKKIEAGRNSAVEILCIEDYRFVGYQSGFGTGISQMWENTPNGPRPVECRKSK